ncbi:hypothetical protein ACQ86G_18855 [Roseateles chitinivorans]|uniref:hypothetical protein n=1 Tax=Roseateles chitinivorans TaxID=2917965 RepID=UPI003D67E606
MTSSSVMPEFPVAGLVLLGLLALVAVVAWARVPGVGARWRAAWPGAAVRAAARAAAQGGDRDAAPRVRAQQRLDAFSVVHELEWADGRRLLVCTTRGAAPVVLDRSTPAGAGEPQP